MIRFSKEKVLLLHKILAEATGGGVGVRDEALLDSALEAAYAGFEQRNSIPPRRRRALDSDMR